MDPVTDSLLGAGLAHAFFKKRAGPEALPALVLAANLPDVDAVVLLTGSPAALTLRRSFGHSLFCLPWLCLALALVLKALYPAKSLASFFRLALLGAGVHVLFDLLTSSGVLLLWPLSYWRPELDLLFVMDLELILILAAPFILCLPRWEGLERGSRHALAAAAGYLILCAASRGAAAYRLSREAAGFGAEVSFVFPEPYGAHRWRGILRKGNLYRAYLLDNFAWTTELKKEIRSDLDDPRVALARRSAAAGWVEPFFKAPVWRGQAQPPQARVYDLKLRPLATDEGLLFEWVFPIGADGTVGKARWSGKASD